MNHCAIKQNRFTTYEEAWSGSVTAAGSLERKGTVVCPKPRRVTLIHPTPDPSRARPLRWYMSLQQEDCDARAGNELLDIILAKGGKDSDPFFSRVASSSPPFFSGSPPSRVSNPLIRDAHFGDNNVTAVSPRATRPIPSGLAPSHVRSSFGSNPSVRIEGFNCLDRENRRNCSIPAVA